MTIGKLFLLGVATSLSLVAAAFASAQTPAEEKSAAQFVEAFHSALKNGDSKAVLNTLADDAIIFESGYAESKSEYAASHLAADITFAKTTKRVVKKSTPHCVDAICVMMQESETSGTYKDKPVKSVGVETSILRSDENGWKITHLHWSSHK